MMTGMKHLGLFSIAVVTAQACVADARPLAKVFTPNAAVCVRFDARGHPFDVAVNGSTATKDVNSAMLKLLKSRKWDAPAKTSVGKWIAMSVAPDGSPVPEILPDCSKLPLTP
jgi:hypothetical protein